MKHLIPLILALSVLPSGVNAGTLVINNSCVPAKNLTPILKDRYGPAPFLKGLSDADTETEIWVNKDGTYAIVLLLNEEVSCIVSSGSGLSPVKPLGKEL
mgnify:FL=1